MDDSTIWKVIDSNFNDNPQLLVRHHIDSYNDFYKNGIHQIFKEKNPIKISSLFDEKTKEYKYDCNLYFGGKNADRIYYGKPVIYDDTNIHYMYPNEARLRNMTYGMTIHYDIEVEVIKRLEKGELPTVIHQDIGEGEPMREEEGKKNNYKKSGGDISDIPSDQEKQKEEEETTGGGPKPTKLKLDATLGEKVAEITTEMAAKIRETTEQSIDGNIQRYSELITNVYLGKFPIMLQSDYCILQGLPREVRHTMGECRNDIGGYFIIDGKEKTIISQEKFADNMLYIRKATDDKYLYSAEIRSVSENVSKPIRTLSVKIMAPTASYTFKNIVVSIPNVRKPVPLFIVFRALGIISDKEIISFCLLDIEKYESMLDLFIPSVHDAATIMTQTNAIKYIASLTKGRTEAIALEILSDFFLPHIGEINYIQKAYALGHMVFRLLSVYTGIEQPTDRDNFKYKRLELVGSLLYDLFREYWNIQQKQIHLAFEKTLYYNPGIYETNLLGLITKNYGDVLRERSLEQGFKKAYKGNWGAYSHTKRVGAVQDLNRLSFNSALNHLRKTNLPLDSSVKLVGPRVLHNSQWGFIDPIDTPDGGSIGLHKHLAIATYITRGMSREPMIEWLREKWAMKLVEEFPPKVLAQMTKVIVNGCWIGSVDEPIESVRKFRLYRRNGLLPIYASGTFDIALNTIFIYTDAGRLCRPIFYRDEETGQASYQNKEIMNVLQNDKFTWEQLTSGFNEKRKSVKFDPTEMRIYTLHELYEAVQGEETNPAKIERFLKRKAVIDYIDTSESENAMIALNTGVFEDSLRITKKDDPDVHDKADASKGKVYTHCEIHESLILGMMCNMIIFPENNPASRNSFSCGQSKQACSLYHTNYQVRMDKTATVLNYGQTPLVKSRYLEHIQQEENSYGENAIVAIMCYTGYNVEDAILVNEGALKRGLFRTSYFSTYEAHEETTKNSVSTVDKRFINIEEEPSVIGTKPGYDYSKLDKHGIIKEGTPVDEKTVLIGLTTVSGTPAGSAIPVAPVHLDGSKTPKKGQLGIVDKAFITDGEEGYRIAKVRILEQRIPAIGDKMASRAGQKGTIGLVIPERDMPFTKEGIRPDLIINPHAIPSRMTIGQLVECITGKACALYGGFGDCTAFNNEGSKIGLFGQLLVKEGFHSSGNEILYNGMTGEQIDSEIFMGPTYYMRLKHMVKDKVNFRALGPRTALTKQPVGGRANDGGLRIGEMERDSIISHGATDFLRESMMERGDKYYMAVCNHTGMIAIYNPSQKIFMSPMADGPIQFTGSLEGSDLRIEQITKFGRSFSVVCIPYSLKLLIQELQTMNIQMRVITDDNLEQVENMAYSKNMEKLTHIKDMKPKDLIEAIKKRIGDKSGKIDISTPDAFVDKTPSPTYPTDVSPAYQPVSNEIPEGIEYNPLSNNPDSPVYDPNSPVYVPGAITYVEDSPPYAPGAITYADDSPPYRPNEENSYSPHSPEEAPPSKGGGSNYNKGDVVMLRGGNDGYPDRPWQISNIADKFLTIRALDVRGLQKGGELKVVAHREIFPAAEAANHIRRGGGIQMGGVQMGGVQMTTGANPQQIMEQIPQMLPSIVIAPKFFNGGGEDHSTSLEPTGNHMSGGGEAVMSSVMPNIPDFIKGGNDNIKTVNTNLDFSKPLIVKKT